MQPVGPLTGRVSHPGAVSVVTQTPASQGLQGYPLSFHRGNRQGEPFFPSLVVLPGAHKKRHPHILGNVGRIPTFRPSLHSRFPGGGAVTWEPDRQVKVSKDSVLSLGPRPTGLVQSNQSYQLLVTNPSL